ncbi:hypothetical protein FZZ93_05610 [Halomonas eurihalina]|uniref:Swt1-like HEPN domain-containing protein n=1 Tax=Halomonas eurihalina TaxID=42566 RepID=A0A5D9DAL4_HALER|nr:hypothetical protein [Halomonas eurihalina]MDR5859441.1 hypothetical protein [Halomonas eurihalina]TZG40523.1 hypothetical protein FZZ93_05610 [Halomonas eurihalina]
MDIEFCRDCGVPTGSASSFLGQEGPICQQCALARVADRWNIDPKIGSARAMDALDKFKSSAINKELINTEGMSPLREFESLDNSPLVQELEKHERLLYSANFEELKRVGSAASAYKEYVDTESPITRQLRNLESCSVLNEIQKARESLLNMGDYPGNRFSALEGVWDSVSLPILQRFPEFQTVAEQMAELSKPVGLVSDLLTEDAWDSFFVNKVGSLHLDWLSDKTENSLIGFAHLARLNAEIEIKHPFSDYISSFVHDEIGAPVTQESDNDAPSEFPGFNQDLVEFEESHYVEVVGVAGFELEIPKLEQPEVLEGGVDPSRLRCESSYIIDRLENSLRKAVMIVAFREGYEFKNIAPGDVLKKCRDRQRNARSLQGSCFELIYYSDFMDLLFMIEGKLLWDSVFKHIFISKNDIKASMQRVHPIRNDVSHSRPIYMEHYLTLVVEAKRIFGCLMKSGLF